MNDRKSGGSQYQNRNGGYQQNRNGGYQQNQNIQKPDVKVSESSYVEDAEKVILYLKNARNKGKLKITTSQIRNILSMAADIYNQLMTEDTSGDALQPEISQRIDYLRVRCIYSAGRDDDVKDFLDVSKLMEQLGKIAGSRKMFMLFYRYMEALVAYHRFHGGRDN